MGKCFIGGGGRTAEPIAFDPIFANNTWEQIIKVGQANRVPDTWAVGDQKTMTINGTDYAIDIIGKNHDDYADGSGKAPLTFQMHDFYSNTYPMNSDATNVGGWTDCAMRNTHLPAILALMPSEVQAGIKEVNKLTSAGNTSATINTTADKLFLLSEIEIFGSINNSKSGEGSQYDYYASGNSTIKTPSGSTAAWWERSPYYANRYYWCSVGYDGGATYSSWSAEGNHLAPAFCF